MVCLFVDHGLQVTDLDLAAGELRFYRSKVDKTQTHRLTRDALVAARAYVESGDAPAMGPLLRASRRGGRLAGTGMTADRISKRVRILGEAIGVEGLSAHDLRLPGRRALPGTGRPSTACRTPAGGTRHARRSRARDAAKVRGGGEGGE